MVVVGCLVVVDFVGAVCFAVWVDVFALSDVLEVFGLDDLEPVDVVGLAAPVVAFVAVDVVLLDDDLLEWVVWVVVEDFSDDLDGDVVDAFVVTVVFFDEVGCLRWDVCRDAVCFADDGALAVSDAFA